MYSFDIFDTLITRTTAEPEGIFILMQERLSTEEYNGSFNEFFKKILHKYVVQRRQLQGRHQKKRFRKFQYMIFIMK